MRLLVFILFLGWLFSGSWYWVCKVRSGCDGKMSDDTIIADRPYGNSGITIWYQDAPIIQSGEDFNFQHSDSSATISPSLNHMLDSLAKFLYYNPYTQLVVTGAFSRTLEVNNTSLSTLGLARSHFVSEELNRRGIESGRVIHSYQDVGMDSGLVAEGILQAGIAFQIVDTPPPREPSVLDNNLSLSEKSAINDSILNNPPLIYFEPNSTYLPLDDTLRTFINKAILFLRTHRDRDLMIIGHTDNQGDAEYNATIGLERARAVKNYFIEFGLNEEQIMIISRGETEPISTHETDTSGAVNRRAELSIK